MSEKRRISTETGSLVGRFSLEGAMKLIADAGFDACDLSLTEEMYGSRVYQEDYRDYAERLKELSEKLGLPFNQAHAPFMSYEEDYEDGTMEKRVERAVEFCGLLEIPVIVIHPIICRDPAKEEAYNVAYFQRLRQTSRRYGITIAIENMYRYDREEHRYGRCVCRDGQSLSKLVDLCGEGFGACLDFGHCRLNGVSVREMADALKGRTVCLHVHDNRGEEDDHLFPFSGTNDWEDSMEALKDNSYAGDITFEVPKHLQAIPEELVPDALTALRKIGNYLKEKY